MWKAHLFCDACQLAYVEAEYKGANDAVRFTKAKARLAEWKFTRNIGWMCKVCLAQPPKQFGEYAHYCGNIITATNVPLHGMRARVFKHNRNTRTVHALFEDPRADSYSTKAHWFFEHEFNAEASHAEDASDGSGEVADTAGAASAGTG